LHQRKHENDSGQSAEIADSAGAAPGSPTIGQTSGWFGKMAIMPLRRWRYGLPGACEHW
jgi:hypothetical protein